MEYLDKIDLDALLSKPKNTSKLELLKENLTCHLAFP